MLNYYTMDLVRDMEGRLFVVDFHGSYSGMFKFLRNAYGNPTERNVREAYFNRIAQEAPGKPIFYAEYAPTSLLSMPPRVAQVLRSNYAAQPEMFDEMSTGPKKLSPAVQEERNRMRKFAENADIPIHIGLFSFTTDEGISYLADIKDGKFCFMKMRDGIYVQRGQTTYPRVDMPVVNDTAVDFSLLTKTWPTWVLGDKAKEYYPEQLVVGMGLSTQEQTADFISRQGKVVFKPGFGLGGLGMKFCEANEITLPENAYTSPVEPTELYPMTVRQALEKLSYITTDFGYRSSRDLSEIIYPFFRQMEERTDDHLGDFGFPVHEFGSSIIQKYVDGELIKAPDGLMHKGYMRAYVIGDTFLAAWYKFPRIEQQSGDFLDIRQHKTTFEPVPDQTLDQVSAFAKSLVQDYENSIKSLGISSISDFMSFRNKKIRVLISQDGRR